MARRLVRVGLALAGMVAATGLAASPWIPSSPLSANAWVHLVLVPLLVSGATVLSSVRVVELVAPLAIALPWVGAILLAWPILYTTSRAVAGTADPARARRRTGFVLVALCGCAVSTSLMGAPRSISAWGGWPYANAGTVALFGALFAAWALLLPRKRAPFLRAAAIAAGVCLATYVLMPLGALILAVWLCVLGVSILQGRPFLEDAPRRASSGP